MKSKGKDEERREGGQPSVAILMCTYNGEDFLTEQLDSFFAQTCINWGLWVSDDGSKDGTLNLLKEKFSKEGAPHLQIFEGPRQGFAANFLSLLNRRDIDADIFALSDQDDIWKAEKLEKAVEWLQSVPAEIPALYASRVELVDADGGHLGYSPLYTSPPSFANALIQNIAGGHAMVINRAARDLLAKAGMVSVPFHDWWIYQLIAGAGGRIKYDPRPTVAYRQHRSNLVGLNTGWKARLSRLGKLFKGNYATYHSLNNAALAQRKAELTPENQNILARFEQARRKAIGARIMDMKNIGLYCQTPAKTVSFWLMVVLGKI